MFTKKTTSSSSSSAASSTAAPALANTAKTSKNSLRGARRRLSVVSDNKLIEGLATLGLVENEESSTAASEHTCVQKYAGRSHKGYASYNLKKRNQDALLMEEFRTIPTLVVGVFDGHGEAGDLVSHYFSDRLAAKLVSNSKFKDDKAKDKDLASAMADEIDRLEKSLLSDVSIDTEFSGTTAVVSMIRGKQLISCNIGDSRCIIGRKEGSSNKLKAVPVTDDHKPDRPDEQKRIIAKGGRVFAVEYEDGTDGPPRVWLGHMDIPGLAMARSLGDTVAHTAGVISEPEITVTELTPNDKVAIWASDGLWEFMSNQEVLDMISGIDDPKKAVDLLITEANSRWMKEEQVIDDTTVVVAFLDVRN